MIDGGIMAENYNGMAVGIFELDSLAACFVALDAASKAANVKITAAMDAALKVAEPLTKIFSHTIIASPAHDTEPAMYMTAGK